MAKKKALDKEFANPQAVLEHIAATINKRYGPGTVMGAPDEYEWERISTGSLSLDCATDGGIPRGSVVEIFGAESTGKTTLSLNIAAKVQQAGGYIVWIDTEHSFDTHYARHIGIDIHAPTWIFSQPATAEAALDTALAYAESGAVQLIVIDSVAQMVPQAELDSESIGDAHIGLLARILSPAMRDIVHPLRQTSTTLLAINQIRSKIGFMQSGTQATGGWAIRFASNMRIELRTVGRIKDHDQTVGIQVKATVIKNRTGAPYREALYEIRFGEGIDTVGELVDLGLEQGAFTKEGTWYKYRDGETEIKLQGREAFRRWLTEQVALQQTLYTQLLPVVPGAEGGLSDAE